MRSVGYAVMCSESRTSFRLVCNRQLLGVYAGPKCIAYTNDGCGTVALSLEIRAKFFIQGIHTNHCYYPTLGICHAQSACVRRNSFGALYQTELFYWQRGRLWWLGGWASRGHSCGIQDYPTYSAVAHDSGTTDNISFQPPIFPSRKPTKTIIGK